jgi:hypothetical protein
VFAVALERNTGRHRYFKNEWLAQILLDIISGEKEPRDERMPNGFWNIFATSIR